VRVYESARRALPTTPKAFLFATARNLMTDRIRHSRVVFIDSTPDFDVLDVLIDEVSPERRLSARQELRMLARAFDSLSRNAETSCGCAGRGILTEGNRAASWAAEGAVESQLARGVRVLALAVLARQMASMRDST